MRIIAPFALALFTLVLPWSRLDAQTVPNQPDVSQQTVVAQSALPTMPPQEWILGTWIGEHSHPTAISSDAARFEFREEGGAIKWKMERQSVVFGTSYWYKASGTAAANDGASVELVGRYDATNADRREVRITGTALKYSLQRAEDTLQGTALGASNVPFSVSLKKSK